MSTRMRKITSAGLAFALAATLVGCGGTAKTTTTTTGSVGSATIAEASATDATTDATTTTADLSGNAGLEAVTITGLDVTDMFTDRDLAGTWDAAEATTIALADGATTVDGTGATVEGNVVTITAEGTYVLSGSLTNGQVVVDVDDASKVQLVLNGVNITNESLAAVYVVNADKVFLTVADGTTNALTTTGTVAQDGDESVDAVVFSHDDLVINGGGSLSVTAGASHGIASSDDLKLVDVTLTVDAADQGIRANNSIRVASGTYVVTATDDALHADSSDDEAGYVYIEDGTLTLSSGDDGIHADGSVLVCGGSVTVTDSYEGIEGQLIGIAAGSIDVTASDDGFNAASSSADAQEASWGFDGDSAQGMQQFGGMMDADASCYLVISGGDITVTAGGDGLDSNGYLTVTGGTTYVYGPENDGNGSIDAGVSATISGGTVLAAGSSGMAETFGSDSSQCSMLVGISGSSGDTITVSDATGSVLVSTTVEKSYACVVVSTPEMEVGQTYTVSNGTTSVQVEMTATSVTSGVTGGMMGGMGGPGMGGDMGAPSDGGMGGQGGAPQGGAPQGGPGGGMGGGPGH